MKKKFLLFGALVGALLLSSCSGGSKKQTVSSESTAELDNASKVINYYHMSLAVLRHVANAKDINAVLGYMEQTGKVPEVELIAPPEIAARDTAEFFNKFLAYKKSKDTAKTAQLLDENYKLSVELSEYKQVIFDILSPLTEQAESELLADEPLKDQIMAMRKMSGTVQSIMNLYSRKHAMDGVRIDLKMAELEKELKAAEKIPAVTGYDEELKNFQSFLSTVKSFMNDMQKARSKGAYSDKEYQAMSEAYEYGLSVI